MLIKNYYNSHTITSTITIHINTIWNTRYKDITERIELHNNPAALTINLRSVPK